ncbi:hypothetical protein ACFX13_001389 [Malus domestica]
MAMAMFRYAGFQTALRGGSRSAAPPRRSFSSSAGHDDAREMAKWEKITYLGIASYTILAFVNLSKQHPHHDAPPAYLYLHILNKDFPWGKNRKTAYLKSWSGAHLMGALICENKEVSLGDQKEESMAAQVARYLIMVVHITTAMGP